MKVYLNNKFIDEEKATIKIKDRGLLLGDSIFDTLLYNKNKIILFDFHFARFNKSIKNNYFNFKLSKNNLQNIILKLIKKNKVSGKYFNDYFIDIGSYKNLKLAKKEFLKKL